MPLLRLLCIVVAVLGGAGLLLANPPLQSWSVVALLVALVTWALASTGRFFLGDAERGARIRPDRVTGARWLKKPTRALALTLQDGTTTVLDEPDAALAMAVALADRGIEVQGDDPGSPPPKGGGYVGPSGKLEGR